MADHDILPPEDNALPSLDDRFSNLWDMVGREMEAMGIDVGFIACKDPETEKTRLFYRGHFYDAAKIVTRCAAELRDQIITEIG